MHHLVQYFERWPVLGRRWMASKITLAVVLFFQIFVFPTVFAGLAGDRPDPCIIEEVKPALPAPYYMPKKAGLYTPDDWREVIDSTWGYGLSDSLKLDKFNTFWNTMDGRYACFQNIEVNWDSIYDRYYTEIIDSGVSRGRFSAILNHSCRVLREAHTMAYDEIVYNTLPEPGVPLLFVGGWGNNDYFGAGLTPLEDSSLLVYEVAENHPLELIPGDIVLGYEGIAWKNLYPQLIEAELPLGASSFANRWVSSPPSITHSWLMACGMNWHLFDTIDIVKYETKDTVHLATSLMVGHDMEIFATEQLPVAGVVRPDFNGGKSVSWGIIEGTNIGYIYCIDSKQEDFSQDWYFAIDSLVNHYQTNGLVFDFRTNYGGNIYAPYGGLGLLFDTSIDYCYVAVRSDPNDHLAMVPYADMPYGSLGFFADSSCFYDKPIAVLTGPGCVSNGDMTVMNLSHHRMARLFGKPTASAFNMPFTLNLGTDFYARYSRYNWYFLDDPDKFLTHLVFPNPDDFPWVDYTEVWLTQDNVAQGTDDVVESALNWIISFDLDQDGIVNEYDNCPEMANIDQEDSDVDGLGDSCDNCIDAYNPDQADDDENGIGNACDFICGDVDDGGSVNILDITYIINYLYKGGPPPNPIQSGDGNGDLSLNLLDITHLINYLYRDGTPPIC